MRFCGSKMRKHRGQMTLVSLAQKLGVDHSTISRWERGYGEPDATVLYNIARILRKPMKAFFRRERRAA